MSYTVYRHITPSGKSYIGITSRDITKRANYNGTGYKGCPLFYSAIVKYGWDNIDHQIIATGLTKEEAEAKEIELISLYGTTDPSKGYNLDNGGNCVGTHSQSTRAKMREALKGKPIGRKASEATKEKHRLYWLENNPQKGKPLTEAQKNAISKANKGRYSGDKHPKARAVKCLTTGEIYSTVKEAGEAVGVAYMSIIQSINPTHRRQTAGKINGVALKWEYVEREETN